jgi:putative endonuclease
MYYVYILQSQLDGDLYKGCTGNYLKRLEQHNSGTNKFTRCKCPWKLIFAQEFLTKAQALIQEKKLKRCNRKYLQWLISQPVNILNKNLDR